MRRVSLLIPAIFLLGCSTTANLYPIKGPLSKQHPLPVITARVNGIAGNTGSMSFVMPNGSKCAGKWSSTAGTSTAVGLGSLWGQYGSLVGYGVSVGSLAKENRGQAMATCDDNNVIEVEFFTGSGTANGFGVAKDKNGNIFRVLF